MKSFVKRCFSQVNLSETLTRGPPDVEGETCATSERKSNLMKRSVYDSVESEDQTNGKDIPSFERQSKHNGLFESPRRQTGQDEESKNPLGMTGWHESPSNQGTEIAKDVNPLSSVKTLEDEGISEAVTDKDPAPSRSRSPDSDNKRAAMCPSDRGRGILAIIPISTSSTPGLIVTEEGKFLAIHLSIWCGGQT